MIGYYIKRLFRELPAPEKNSERVVEFTYREIERICRENQARMAVVIITNPAGSRKPLASEIAILNNLSHAVIVNTEPALLNALPVRSEQAYSQTYLFYSGQPRVFIEHPNDLAHQIMADEIIKVLSPSE